MDPRPETRTHRDLIPRGACPALRIKHILTHALDDVVWDDRDHPGDGYSWCANTGKDVGPDDDLAAPDSCVSGRRCWEGTPAG